MIQGRSLGFVDGIKANKRFGSVIYPSKYHIAAGYLIDQSGLKGFRIGDAEISTKHANFIINRGKAKSKDIIKLINIAKNEVFKKFKIELKLEIKLLGFEYD